MKEAPAQAGDSLNFSGECGAGSAKTWKFSVARFVLLPVLVSLYSVAVQSASPPVHAPEDRFMVCVHGQA
jgi:hypothetical protein